MRVVRHPVIVGNVAIIPLTKSKHSVVDIESIDCVYGYNWYATGGPWTSYAARTGRDGEPGVVLMHREIMGHPDADVVDHIDGCGLNNTKVNLRAATYSGNAQNSKTRCDNTSGAKGVRFRADKGKWQARINRNGREYHLGYFVNKDSAVLAHRAACLNFHGEFASSR